ncbi:MAG: TonB-dependent receptor [Methylococcales bacterium]|nr:TonB-dependent receptor [Methylococcales bacterium]
MPLSDDIIVYLQGTTNYRESESSAFFRRPLDNRNVRSIYPNGFLPLISPTIFDYNATVGVKGETNFNLNWDLSHTVGGNHIDYTLNNSLNTSLGIKSPTTFDAGGLGVRQHVTNLDLFKSVDLGLDSPIKIATGFEWRYEMFEINAGEEDSYRDGGVPVLDGPNTGQTTMAGVQGFPGFSQENATQKDRHNFATYIDLNTQFYDSISVGLAGRYEYYSDFGSTLNGKFSLGYQVVDSILLRGSVSTGFRAPSLQQSFFNSTSSLIDGGEINSVATIALGSPLANALDARLLKPETSKNFTMGFIYKPTENFSVSVDYFYTQIIDRIILSDNISIVNAPEITPALEPYGLWAARGFINAIDTETQGVDLRANYELDFKNKGHLKLSARYHYNKNRVDGPIQSRIILDAAGNNLSFSEKERERLEFGQPNESLILMAHYKSRGFDGVIKLIKAGAFSEEAQRLKSQWLADIDLSYQVHSNFNVAVGVHNLLDSQPSRNALNGQLLTSSPYGYNGGFYYFRLTADF